MYLIVYIINSTLEAELKAARAKCVQIRMQ